MSRVGSAIVTLQQAEEALRKHDETEVADEVYALAVSIGGETSLRIPRDALGRCEACLSSAGDEFCCEDCGLEVAPA